jgi:hypothetical protein
MILLKKPPQESNFTSRRGFRTHKKSYKKVLKTITYLKKGSYQKRHKFNPKNVSEDEREKVDAWVSNVQNRESISEIDPNTKKIALNKLHKLTKVTRHPKTGERMFLLHRGMGESEYKKYSQGCKTSWAPHGEHNRKNPEQTIYAEQKAGLMPDHIINGNWHPGDE